MYNVRPRIGMQESPSCQIVYKMMMIGTSLDHVAHFRDLLAASQHEKYHWGQKKKQTLVLK